MIRANPKDLMKRLEQEGRRLMADLGSGRRKIPNNQTTLEVKLPFGGEEGEVYITKSGYEWFYVVERDRKTMEVIAGGWQFTPPYNDVADRIRRREGRVHECTNHKDIPEASHVAQREYAKSIGHRVSRIDYQNARRNTRETD